MSFIERIKIGEVCVAQQYDGSGKIGLKVGDQYLFNYKRYKVVEICDGDLKGHVWIAEDK